MVFQQNLLKKSYFIAKMSGQACQFWLLESALSLQVIFESWSTETFFICFKKGLNPSAKPNR